MLLALHTATEQGIDIVSVVKVIGGLGASSLLALGLLAFAKGWVVPGSRIVELQRQLDAKDAALQRKDETIESLQSGMIDKAIPALARATLVLEKFHTDTTVRRSE